jgi:hypothetical protein
MYAKARYFLTRFLFPHVPIRRVGEVLERYLREVACARLSVPPRDFGTYQMATDGNNVYAYRWEHPGIGPTYARAWRYDLTVRCANEHRFAGGLLAEAGLSVPELLLCDDSLRTIRRYRLEVAVERAAQGSPLPKTQPVPAPILQAWARDLAALHRQSGPAWGKPWRPTNPMVRPREYHINRVRLLKERLRRGRHQLRQREIGMATERLILQLERHPFVRPRLVHGDVTPGNLFVEGERLTWIDFGTVHYGLAETDLVLVRNWLAPLGQFDDFLGRYLELRGESVGNLEESLDLCQAFSVFEKLSARVTRLKRGTISPERERQLLADAERFEGQFRQVFDLA